MQSAFSAGKRVTASELRVTIGFGFIPDWFSLRTQTYFRLSFLSARKRQPEIRLRSQAMIG